jgi:hypothetical protein
LDTGDIAGKELIFWIPDDSRKEEMQKIEIAAVGQSKDLPAYFSRGYSPEIIVSQSYLAQITDNLVTELIEVSYKTPLSDKTEKQIKDIFKEEQGVSFDSKLDRFGAMKQNSE